MSAPSAPRKRGREALAESLTWLSQRPPADIEAMIKSLVKGLNEGLIDIAVETTGFSAAIRADFYDSVKAGELSREEMSKMIDVLGHLAVHFAAYLEDETKPIAAALKFPEKLEPYLQTWYKLFKQEHLIEYYGFKTSMLAPTLSLPSLDTSVRLFAAKTPFNFTYPYAEVGFSTTQLGDTKPVMLQLDENQVRIMAKRLSELLEEIKSTRESLK